MRSLLVVSIALAIGCRNESVARLEAIRDEVCACKTAQCGEAAMSRIPQDKVKASHRAQRIARAMMDCMAKLYLAERPETGPDTEQPEAPTPTPEPAPTPTGP